MVGGGAGVGQRVVGDAGLGVGFNQRGVEIGLFAGSGLA